MFLHPTHPPALLLTWLCARFGFRSIKQGIEVWPTLTHRKRKQKAVSSKRHVRHVMQKCS